MKKYKKKNYIKIYTAFAKNILMVQFVKNKKKNKTFSMEIINKFFYTHTNYETIEKKVEKYFWIQDKIPTFTHRIINQLND